MLAMGPSTWQIYELRDDLWVRLSKLGRQLVPLGLYAPVVSLPPRSAFNYSGNRAVTPRFLTLASCWPFRLGMSGVGRHELSTCLHELKANPLLRFVKGHDGGKVDRPREILAFEHACMLSYQVSPYGLTR